MRGGIRELWLMWVTTRFFSDVCFIYSLNEHLIKCYMVPDTIRNVADATVDKIKATHTHKKIIIMPYGFNSERCKIKKYVRVKYWYVRS